MLIEIKKYKIQTLKNCFLKIVNSDILENKIMYEEYSFFNTADNNIGL